MSQYIVVAFKENEPDRYCVLQERKDGYVIGRETGADLLLPDITISRRHAVIFLRNSQIIIEDSGSTNGVILNGERVNHSCIREGDFLMLGAYTLVLRLFDPRKMEEHPRGSTNCISYDTARKWHDEQLKEHGAEYFPALYKATLLLGGNLLLEELLRQILLLVLDAMGAKRGAVLTIEEGSRESKIAVSLSLDDGLGDIPISYTMVNYVVQTKIALSTPNALADPRFEHAQSVFYHRIGAALCAPLCCGTDVYGVFYIDHHDSKTRFAGNELEFLSAVGHVVGMAIETKRKEARLLRQERLAAIGQAIAGITHDVRNILGGIVGGLSFLQDSYQANNKEGTESALDIVQASTGQLNEILTKLLNFAKDTTITCKAANIYSLLDNVISIAQPMAQRQRVELICQKGSDDPVNLDERQIHRVIFNLVKNGIESCGDQGGVVTISTERDIDTLLIQIKDTGSGISAETIPRLFEPFYSTKGETGTGLGLANSQRIVELHGGKITVASSPGKGSVFTVILPHCSLRQQDSLPLDIFAPAYQGKFKSCPACHQAWPTRDAFLADPTISLVGYQPNFDELLAGLFHFNHQCGTVLAVSIVNFANLYDGPIMSECRRGQEDCPGYCLHRNDLRPCPAQCVCAFVRQILQTLQAWPKVSLPPK